MKKIMAVLACLAILGGGFAYVYDKYDTLLEKQKSVGDEVEKLSAQRLAFEKEKYQFLLLHERNKQKLIDSSRELSLKENSLKEKELNYKELLTSKAKKNNEVALQEILEQRKLLSKEQNSLNVKKSELEDLITEYNKKADQVILLDKIYSATALRVEAENRIQEKMTMFGSLGVDLGHQDPCDKEYTKRYNEAESLIDQISVIASANDLVDKYDWFVRTNRPLMISGKNKDCELKN